MRKLLITTSLLLFTVACTNTEGLSAESSRTAKGNLNSSIVIEEFGDLQCPACQGAHGLIIEPLMEEYGNVIKLEFKHFPLRNIHPFAQEAAEAAECAADQGKFWEFTYDIYESKESQAKLSRDDHTERAERVGVTDLDLFKRCHKSRIKKDTVQADFNEGKERGVNSTPTFFIGGEKVPRNNIEVIKALIDQRLKAQRL